MPSALSHLTLLESLLILSFFREALAHRDHEQKQTRGLTGTPRILQPTLRPVAIYFEAQSRAWATLPSLYGGRPDEPTPNMRGRLDRANPT